jgi:ribokinase
MNEAVPFSRPKILVIGSVNMDLVYRVVRLPRPGETLMGLSFQQIQGGKGGNQAVAASRLGADVALIGRVGEDEFGNTLLAGLCQEGVNCERLLITTGVSSGLAMIGVEDSGQNSIVVIPGANGLVTPDDVQASELLFRDADALLLQFEIPLPSVVQAIELARVHGVRVIVDPAPAQADVPESVFSVDVLCPNETEAEALSGVRISTVADAMQAAHQIRVRGDGGTLVLITMGHQGVVRCDSTGCEHIPPFAVNAVDTTAAGDAFAGALAVALASGLPTDEAIHFASAAGALAATRPGAQPAMPHLADVQARMAGELRAGS